MVKRGAILSILFLFAVLFPCAAAGGAARSSAGSAAARRAAHAAWVSVARSSIRATPAVAAGRVYSIARDRQLRCFDALTGAPIFTVGLGVYFYHGAVGATP